MLNFENYLQQ